MSRFKFNPSREVCSKIGYGVSALWMIGVLIHTGADTRHPFFQYIFIVPLTGWIVVLAVDFALKKRRR